MMLACWRHSAARRPSFMQLLDELAADMSDEFRNVSYYFNHDPDIDDAAAHSDLLNSQYASAEDVSETAPFRTASDTQLRLEASNSAGDVKVSDVRNSSDQNELQLSGFVGQSSAERKPRSLEFIEMSSPLKATTANSALLSSQPDHHMGDEEHQNSQRSSRETGPSRWSDVHFVDDSDNKESSGSSQSSHMNGLIKGHVIPLGSALPSEVR